MAVEAIRDIKTKPIYVGFFHGEFDVCPPSSKTPPLTTIPNNVALMHMTKPGEFLTLSSPILYYLLHKKDFYINTLLPLFLLETPEDLQYHPNAEYVYWDMEQRKGHAFEEVVESSKKLITAEAAGALKLMKEITLRKTPYEPATDKTVFSEVLRYDGGDEVPNLKLSVYEDNLLGLGLYKYSPATNKVERVVLDAIRSPTFRVSDLLDYVGSHGSGGKLVLFSCSSLAPETITRHRNKVLEVREYIESVQTRYIQRNPVVSPRDAEGWSAFLQAFPKVQMPNLTFLNFNTLKAHDDNYANWILYNLLVTGEFYKDTPLSWRSAKLQNTAPYGRQIQNFGQNCEATTCCRSRKKGCTIQGGKGKWTKRTRRIKRSRNY
jgi:hypothetical protein